MRLSAALDKLEDKIGEATYNLSDAEDKRLRATAISRHYWTTIITRTITENNKLIIRVLNHSQGAMRYETPDSNIEYYYFMKKHNTPISRVFISSNGRVMKLRAIYKPKRS